MIPEADPRLLTRAVLGLHNSVWHWYRSDGTLPLARLSDFYVHRCLAVLGLPPELAGNPRARQTFATTNPRHKDSAEGFAYALAVRS